MTNTPSVHLDSTQSASMATHSASIVTTMHLCSHRAQVNSMHNVSMDKQWPQNVQTLIQYRPHVHLHFMQSVNLMAQLNAFNVPIISVHWIVHSLSTMHVLMAPPNVHHVQGYPLQHVWPEKYLTVILIQCQMINQLPVFQCVQMLHPCHLHAMLQTMLHRATIRIRVIHSTNANMWDHVLNHPNNHAISQKPMSALEHQSPLHGHVKRFQEHSRL